tara:strand:+ start:25 stop:333 length:309 start_codon:yes stop_codon:yes gene_type:complete
MKENNYLDLAQHRSSAIGVTQRSYIAKGFFLTASPGSFTQRGNNTKLNYYETSHGGTPYGKPMKDEPELIKQISPNSITDGLSQQERDHQTLKEWQAHAQKG